MEESKGPTTPGEKVPVPVSDGPSVDPVNNESKAIEIRR